MKNFSSEEVISMLMRQGGIVQRSGGKGSHTKVLINGVVVIVPYSKEQPIGTQKSIEKTAGVKLRK